MCKYCAYSGGLSQSEAEYGLKAESMSFETFARAIDQMKNFEDKFKIFHLSGQGELLLNTDIADMVRCKL